MKLNFNKIIPEEDVVHEKRRADRAFLTVAVTIEYDDLIIRGGECRNLSTTGMLVYIKTDIPEGAHGTVTLTKKCNSRRYSFSADFEVVRKEIHKVFGPGIAIRFLRVFEEDMKSIEYIVNFHLALSFREKLNINEDDIKGIKFKIAQSKDELEQAFSIVHDMYVQEGYIDPQPHGMRICLHHSLPFTTTFIGLAGSEVIIACTLFLDSVIGLPMDSLYKKELDVFRNSHRLIAESGAFAVKPGYKNSSTTLVIHLQKMITHYVLRYFNLDDFVITINPKHRMFYKYVFLMEQIGQEKPYSSVNGNPAIAMYSNIRSVESKMRESYDNFPPEKNVYDFIFKKESKCFDWPPNHAPVIVMNRELVNYFFEAKTNIFTNTKQDIVNSILNFY
jgi:hypothetical protein